MAAAAAEPLLLHDARNPGFVADQYLFRQYLSSNAAPQADHVAGVDEELITFECHDGRVLIHLRLLLFSRLIREAKEQISNMEEEEARNWTVVVAAPFASVATVRVLGDFLYTGVLACRRSDLAAVGGLAALYNVNILKKAVSYVESGAALTFPSTVSAIWLRYPQELSKRQEALHKWQPINALIYFAGPGHANLQQKMLLRKGDSFQGAAASTQGPSNVVKRRRLISAASSSGCSQSAAPAAAAAASARGGGASSFPPTPSPSLSPASSSTAGPRCGVCDDQLADDNGLERHLKKHINYPKVTCIVCSSKFTELFNLRTHLRTHSYDTVSAAIQLVLPDDQLMQLGNYPHGKTAQRIPMTEADWVEHAEVEVRVNREREEYDFLCRLHRDYSGLIRQETAIYVGKMARLNAEREGRSREVAKKAGHQAAVNATQEFVPHLSHAVKNGLELPMTPFKLQRLEAAQALTVLRSSGAAAATAAAPP